LSHSFRNFARSSRPVVSSAFRFRSSTLLASSRTRNRSISANNLHVTDQSDFLYYKKQNISVRSKSILQKKKEFFTPSGVSSSIG
jgi:hypothetical protein